jgi:plasmid stabilization system protein ParE
LNVCAYVGNNPLTGRTQIVRDNPVRAASFVVELEGKCRAVAASPELYPARADLAPALRMAVHGRYLVLYRDLPGEDTVRIERQPPALTGEVLTLSDTTSTVEL